MKIWKEKYGKTCQGFPGGPVVKTSSSNAGDEGLIPSWGTKIPHASRPKKKKKKNHPKTENKSNIVTNPIKTFKNNF